MVSITRYSGMYLMDMNKWALLCFTSVILFLISASDQNAEGFYSESKEKLLLVYEYKVVEPRNVTPVALAELLYARMQQLHVRDKEHYELPSSNRGI